MFNAIKYTKDLEEKGFDRDQAEVLVGLIMQMLEFNMVSRSEFEKFQAEMRYGFERVDQRFERIEQKIESLDLKVDDKLNKLTLQLTVKLGILLAVSVGLISTILAIKL